MKMDSLEPELSVPTYVSQLRTKKLQSCETKSGFEARRWSSALQQTVLIQWLLQLKNV